MTAGNASELKSPATLAALLVDQLVAALVNVRIYASTHPRVQASLAAAQAHLADLAATWREDPVRLGVADGMLFFQQRPLLSASLAAARLIEPLQRWGAGGLELHSSATQAELHELLTGLSRKQGPAETFVDLNQALAATQCRHVFLLPPYVDPKGITVGDHPDSGARLRVAMSSFQGVIDLLQGVTVSVCRGGQIDFGPVREQAALVLDHLRLDDGPLLNLTRRGQYDAFTFGHSTRTAVLALSLARTLTDDRELLTRIGIAALLHDVGKALVPFELLHVQRPLSADELAQVRRHPQLGAEILLDHRDSDELAIAAAFGHHCGAPGGYPQTAHRHEVALVTEIMKICDIYEALTAARPHRRPMSPVRAYRLMLSMQQQFDRRLLRRFITNNGIYPIGQKVVLQSGEQALVREHGRLPTAPVVELITDPHGVALDPADRPRIDLGTDVAGALRVIVGEAETAIDGAAVGAAAH
jgi:HD-GYP domain-containing protein (c-di-GMP phosphodiesterase class II)